jgi:hypothetical protein
MYLLVLAYAFLLGFSVPLLVSVWVLRKRRRSWDSVFVGLLLGVVPYAVGLLLWDSHFPAPIKPLGNAVEFMIYGAAGGLVPLGQLPERRWLQIVASLLAVACASFIVLMAYSHVPTMPEANEERMRR